MSIEFYGKLTYEQINFIQSAIGHHTYLLGGSMVTNPETANDIDIIVHEYHHDVMDKNTLYRAGFYELQQGDEKYDEIDRNRLMEVYAGTDGIKKYNIIVVGALYWPAYVGALREMEAHPEMYQKREERIVIHKNNCKAIRQMCGYTDEE